MSNEKYKSIIDKLCESHNLKAEINQNIGEERFDCWKINDNRGIYNNLLLVYPQIKSNILNTRVGKLLFNIETKQFCFGIRDNDHSMIATTITDKGEFFNSLLMIVISI